MARNLRACSVKLMDKKAFCISKTQKCLYLEAESKNDFVVANGKFFAFIYELILR